MEHVLSLTSEGKDELRRRLREADGAQISDENHWFRYGHCQILLFLGTLSFLFTTRA